VFYIFFIIAQNFVALCFRDKKLSTTAGTLV